MEGLGRHTSVEFAALALLLGLMLDRGVAEAELLGHELVLEELLGAAEVLHALSIDSTCMFLTTSA